MVLVFAARGLDAKFDALDTLPLRRQADEEESDQESLGWQGSSLRSR